RQPPPVLEEESVKEVLSETPIAKRNQVPILKPESDTLLPPLQNPDDKIESKNPHPIPNPIIINKKEATDPCRGSALTAKFWNWFDSESWYPLGRIIGGTLYPGLMLTAAALYWVLRFFRFAVHIRE
ncbi:hypothetical protein S83_043144, partial [Arachis hypogaea]